MTKVLYIEHDDDNLYMLKMRLERIGGFEVLAADDSEKGCKLALSERPDVILMDLEMPVVDRWQPLRTLKNDPQTRDIPIIGMSAYALDSEREQAVATGATSLMSNRSSSSLYSPPFGASSRTRNNSPALLGRCSKQRQGCSEAKVTRSPRRRVIVSMSGIQFPTSSQSLSLQRAQTSLAIRLAVHLVLSHAAPWQR